MIVFTRRNRDHNLALWIDKSHRQELETTARVVERLTVKQTRATGTSNKEESTVLIVIVLMLISIVFPPAWLALAAYVVYLLLTKKERRSRVIMYEIRKLIATGREEVILKHVYYEAAKGFAAEHGASMSSYRNDPEDDCLMFNLIVDGSEYHVCVQRWMKDETMLTVRTKERAREYLFGHLGKDLLGRNAP
jgi:hypothetical protein